MDFYKGIAVPDQIGFPHQGGHFLQSPEEIHKLIDVLLDKELKYVVEIGTGFGGTSLIWAQLVKPQNGKVITIDRERLDTAWFNGTEFAKYIDKIIGNSRDPRALAVISGIIPHIDMLFIDGDHSYAGVKLDFDTYTPFVKKPGGIIILHDIIDMDERIGSPKFWLEIKPNYKTLEIIGTKPVNFIESGLTPGIGVIFLE